MYKKKYIYYKEHRSTKIKLLTFWLVCNSIRLMCKFCLILTLKRHNNGISSHLVSDYTNDHIKGVSVGVIQPVHTL